LAKGYVTAWGQWPEANVSEVGARAEGEAERAGVALYVSLATSSKVEEERAEGSLATAMKMEEERVEGSVFWRIGLMGAGEWPWFSAVIGGMGSDVASYF